MTPPYNRYLVKAETNLQTELVFKSGVKLYRYPGFDPSNFATMIATVSGIPRAFKYRLGYEGIQLPDLHIGDEVMVRYDVFSTTRDQPDRDSVRYANELYYEGQSQWFADVMQIMAVKRGDGWEMLNGYVWLDVVMRNILNPLIPEHLQSKVWKGKGIAKYIGEPLTDDGRLDIAPGDTVYFDSRFPMVYELDNQRFYIVKQKYIHVVESNESEGRRQKATD